MCIRDRIGAVKGYKTKIIMPDSVSEERRKLVKGYGAEVILVHDDGDIGACIARCMEPVSYTHLGYRDPGGSDLPLWQGG